MFEWDEDKNQENIAKHGLKFEDAEHVFNGATFTFEDTRYDYSEPRFITFGLLHERMIVIAHTPRGETTCIISMRKGNKREQKTYSQRLKAH